MGINKLTRPKVPIRYKEESRFQKVPS